MSAEYKEVVKLIKENTIIVNIRISGSIEIYIDNDNLMPNAHFKNEDKEFLLSILGKTDSEIKAINYQYIYGEKVGVILEYKKGDELK
jgi:hypothetical protein